MKPTIPRGAPGSYQSEAAVLAQSTASAALGTIQRLGEGRNGHVTGLALVASLYPHQHVDGGEIVAAFEVGMSIHVATEAIPVVSDTLVNWIADQVLTPEQRAALAAKLAPVAVPDRPSVRRGIVHNIRALFAWHTIIDTGVWLYQMNDLTLERRAVDRNTGYQPLDFEWLNANGRIGKVISKRYRNPFNEERAP